LDGRNGSGESCFGPTELNCEGAPMRVSTRPALERLQAMTWQ